MVERGVGGAVRVVACGAERAEEFRGLGFVVTGEHSHDGFQHPTWLSLRKEIGGGQPEAS